MSIMTAISNFRANRKIEQEKTNAGQVTQKARSGFLPVMGVPFALAFVFMLMSLASPASAVEINLTAITDVINAFIGIIEPIINLVIAIIPLWFIMQILGFIMGLLAAILAMIRFGRN